MTDVFKKFPFTPPAPPDHDYHVVNKKYVDDNYVWSQTVDKITYSPTEPANPTIGDLWIDVSGL